MTMNIKKLVRKIKNLKAKGLTYSEIDTRLGLDNEKFLEGCSYRDVSYRLMKLAIAKS